MAGRLRADMTEPQPQTPKASNDRPSRIILNFLGVSPASRGRAVAVQNRRITRRFSRSEGRAQLTGGPPNGFATSVPNAKKFLHFIQNDLLKNITRASDENKKTKKIVYILKKSLILLQKDLIWDDESSIVFISNKILVE